MGKWKLGGEREQVGNGGSQGNNSRIQKAGASKNSKSSISSASMVKKLESFLTEWFGVIVNVDVFFGFESLSMLMSFSSNKSSAEATKEQEQLWI